MNEQQTRVIEQIQARMKERGVTATQLAIDLAQGSSTSDKTFLSELSHLLRGRPRGWARLVAKTGKDRQRFATILLTELGLNLDELLVDLGPKLVDCWHPAWPEVPRDGGPHVDRGYPGRVASAAKKLEQGEVLWVVGPAGVGKTRCLDAARPSLPPQIVVADLPSDPTQFVQDIDQSRSKAIATFSGGVGQLKDHLQGRGAVWSSGTAKHVVELHSWGPTAVKELVDQLVLVAGEAVGLERALTWWAATPESEAWFGTPRDLGHLFRFAIEAPEGLAKCQTAAQAAREVQLRLARVRVDKQHRGQLEVFDRWGRRALGWAALADLAQSKNGQVFIGLPPKVMVSALQAEMDQLRLPYEERIQIAAQVKEARQATGSAKRQALDSLLAGLEVPDGQALLDMLIASGLLRHEQKTGTGAVAPSDRSLGAHAAADALKAHPQLARELCEPVWDLSRREYRRAAASFVPLSGEDLERLLEGPASQHLEVVHWLTAAVAYGPDEFDADLVWRIAASSLVLLAMHHDDGVRGLVDVSDLIVDLGRISRRYRDQLGVLPADSTWQWILGRAAPLTVRWHQLLGVASRGRIRPPLALLAHIRGWSGTEPVDWVGRIMPWQDRMAFRTRSGARRLVQDVDYEVLEYAASSGDRAIADLLSGVGVTVAGGAFAMWRNLPLDLRFSWLVKRPADASWSEHLKLLRRCLRHAKPARLATRAVGDFSTRPLPTHSPDLDWKLAQVGRAPKAEWRHWIDGLQGAGAATLSAAIAGALGRQIHAGEYEIAGLLPSEGDIVERCVALAGAAYIGCDRSALRHLLRASDGADPGGHGRRLAERAAAALLAHHDDFLLERHAADGAVRSVVEASIGGAKADLESMLWVSANLASYPARSAVVAAIPNSDEARTWARQHLQGALRDDPHRESIINLLLQHPRQQEKALLLQQDIFATPSGRTFYERIAWAVDHPDSEVRTWATDTLAARIQDATHTKGPGRMWQTLTGRFNNAFVLDAMAQAMASAGPALEPELAELAVHVVAAVERGDLPVPDYPSQSEESRYETARRLWVNLLLLAERFGNPEPLLQAVRVGLGCGQSPPAKALAAESLLELAGYERIERMEDREILRAIADSDHDFINQIAQDRLFDLEREWTDQEVAEIVAACPWEDHEVGPRVSWAVRRLERTNPGLLAETIRIAATISPPVGNADAANYWRFLVEDHPECARTLIDAVFSS